jgi:hypothetical protein
MKILLGDFNAKPTIGNESLHEISNGTGVTVLTLPHPKILSSKL